MSEENKEEISRAAAIIFIAAIGLLIMLGIKWWLKKKGYTRRQIIMAAILFYIGSVILYLFIFLWSVLAG